MADTSDERFAEIKRLFDDDALGIGDEPEMVAIFEDLIARCDSLAERLGVLERDLYLRSMADRQILSAMNNLRILVEGPTP